MHTLGVRETGLTLSLPRPLAWGQASRDRRRRHQHPVSGDTARPSDSAVGGIASGNAARPQTSGWLLRLPCRQWAAPSSGLPRRHCRAAGQTRRDPVSLGFKDTLMEERRADAHLRSALLLGAFQKPPLWTGGLRRAGRTPLHGTASVLHKGTERVGNSCT